ncbi:double-strand break repair helicase AddA [Pelagibius litoralis]|uniref:DNA 3'-5' helicase n=1 Tax=Pelagibius litoralis TaxID=374515 RepID=A0A967EV11_9PROT|nr:double-strand break repair helicase AddA [Pelagibius litoralis]NIA68001.1 double-strand break repair helicase AddA [Pelagibius litoralis]
MTLSAKDPLAKDIVARASAAQQQAADPGASVWVSASAGSGKTKVLVDRVLSLLLTGSEPGKVLCLTFTKAAAAEMANRLSDRLAGWVTAEEGALRTTLEILLGSKADDAMLLRARALFARVLDTPGGIKILTIHAFCQSLLGRFPLEAAVAPHAQVLDEHEAAELLESARLEVLSHALEGQGRLADAIGILTAHLQEERFGEVLGQLMHERGRLAELFAARGGVDRLIEAIFGFLGVEPGETPDAAQARAAAEGAFDRSGLRLAAEAWSKGTAAEQKKAAPLFAWLAAEDALRAETFEEHCGLFLTKDGQPRQRQLTKKPAEAFPGALEALQNEAERLALVAQHCNAVTVAQATGALLILGDAIIAAYQRHKQARVLLDYDDLIHFSLRLLERQGGVSWVLFKLDGGLDHILVDEAQDTSPEQWRIVELLTGDFFSGAGAQDEGDAPPRSVFAVGDPKQSIYSFQRADPAAFQAMRLLFQERAQQAERRWRPVSLAVSFRSTEAVLGLVDAVFANPAAQDGVLFGESEIRHAAARHGQPGLVEVWPPAPPAEEEELAPWSLPLLRGGESPAPLRLARLVAYRIWYWTQSAEGATDPACSLAAKGRRIQPGDVMILVRRRNAFITELVRELKNRGVPVAGVDRMRLGEQLAVMDLVALGRVLLLPEDDLTLAAVLKSPLVGLNEDQLFALAHGRGKASLWDRLRRFAEGGAPDPDPAFARARDFLADLAARADFVAPFELYSALLGAGRGREKLLARLGPDAADPIEEFLSLALAYERENTASLEGFLHWLMAGDLEIKRDLEQAQGAVRLMTVHGSKGLEAPVIILPDTLQLPRGGDGLLWVDDGVAAAPLSIWPVKRDYALDALEAARSEQRLAREQEYRRLLYVALTRAEDRLYVCGWQTRKAAPDGNWFQLVASAMEVLTDGGATGGGSAEAVDFDFTGEVDEGWSGPGWRYSLGSPEARLPATAAAEPLLESKDEPAPLPAWAREAAPVEPAPPQPLAPSRPSESEPPVRSPLVGSGAERDDGQRFKRGRLIHRLLQTLPDLAVADRPAAGQRFLASPLHDLGSAEAETILTETLAVLDDPALAPLFGPGSRAEVPLAGLVEGLAGPQVISGQVDRLLIEDRTISLVDFKTQRPSPRTPESVPRLYLRQMAAYRALLQKIYPGRAILSYLLWTDQPRLMQLSDALLKGHAP